MYKKIALLDSTDFTGELEELFDTYVRSNTFYQDTLITFYYDDFIQETEDNDEDLLPIKAIMKEIYTLYPELSGQDLYIRLWW